MQELSDRLRAELIGRGAALVGFADLTVVPPEQRLGMPVGVAVALAYPKDVIRMPDEMPNPDYHAQYNALNKGLDALVIRGAGWLCERGYRAFAQSLDTVGGYSGAFETRLPHKTVATRAGLGWIGKCALLVNETYGSAIRLSAILTDADLQCDKPVDVSRCGDCRECQDICTAGAVQGLNWRVGMAREEYYDAAACSLTAKERSQAALGRDYSICGRCISVCPYTRGYLARKQS